MLLSRLLGAFKFHALGLSLLLLQATLACAVTALALAFVLDRADKVAVPAGLTESGLAILAVNDSGDAATRVSRRLEVLTAIRRTPGVAETAVTSHMPLGDGESSFGVCANRATFEAAVAAGSIDRPGCGMVAGYSASPGLLRAAGIRLEAGRDLQESDFHTATPDVALISRAFGQRLYGTGPILGQRLQTGPESAVTIVGIVDNLLRPNPKGEPGDSDILILPQWPTDAVATYVVRTRDGYEPSAVTKAAVEHLKAIDPAQTAESSIQTFNSIRHHYFSRDYGLISMLSFVLAALITVTGVGFFSLTWMWVNKRRRSIGVQRALGARRSRVIRDVLSENAVLVGAGSMLGTALIAATLPWMRGLGISTSHIASAVGFGWLLTFAFGQLAALGPALRAAQIAPAVAAKA